MSGGKHVYVPILHHVNVLNWLTFIISMISLLSVYGICLSRRETVSIPPFSQAINGSLEYRINSILMSAQFIIMAVLMYLRVSVYIISAVQKDRFGTERFIAFRWIIIIGGWLLCFGSLAMSLTPEARSMTLSVVFLYVFYFGALAYFIGSDLMLAYIGKPSGVLSRVCTWVGALTMILHLVMGVHLSVGNSDVRSIGTTFGIVAFMLIELKVTLIGLDGPKYAIRMSGRNA